MPVNEEEQSLIESALDQGELEDESLSERGQEVARKMVSRGLFNRLARDGKLYYVPNGLPKIWRF